MFKKVYILYSAFCTHPAFNLSLQSSFYTQSALTELFTDYQHAGMSD